MDGSNFEKMKDMFGDNVSNDELYYRKTDGGVVIGKDEDTGEDIIMDPKKIVPDNKFRGINASMDKMLELDKELVKSLTSREAIAKKEEEQRKKDYKKFDMQLIKEGIDPNSPMAQKRREVYEASRRYLKFPKVLDHYMTNDEIEEYKDKLTLDEIEQLKSNKRAGLYVTPEMIIGSREGNRKAAESPDFQTMEFLRYCRAQGIDISTIDDNFLNQYMKEYFKGRRPGLHIVIDTCVEELEAKLIKDLMEDPDVPNELIETYRNSKDARIQVVKESKPFTMEDFRIFEYYFKKFGRNPEDKEYFNPEKKIRSDVYMKDYFTKFYERTGFDFLDVYHYYYKKVEKEETKGTFNDDKKVIGEESIDNIQVNESNTGSISTEKEKEEPKETYRVEDILEDFGDVDFD